MREEEKKKFWRNGNGNVQIIIGTMNVEKKKIIKKIFQKKKEKSKNQKKGKTKNQKKEKPKITKLKKKRKKKKNSKTQKANAGEHHFRITIL